MAQIGGEWNRRGLGAAALISLVSLMAFFPALHTYFLTDDFGYLHVFQTLSPHRFLDLFHADVAQILWNEPRQELRPFYGVFYAANYRLWGLQPLGYHLCGLVLHIGVSFLIFQIASEITGGKSVAAAFAGLLYAVLPAHAQTLSLIVGAVAECLPTFLYLATFLCFMRFRTTRRVPYLAASIALYAVALMSKEAAVSLPVMIAGFDLYRLAVGEESFPSAESSAKSKFWQRLILPYVPFIILLLAYVELRRFVFASFLHENSWAGNVHDAASSPAGFWIHTTHLISRFRDLHGFNLHQLLSPFSIPVIAAALGLCVAGTIALAKSRRESRKTIAAIIFFGAGWYFVSTLPLMAVMHVPYHLYLPMVGPCIAIALVAAPLPSEGRGTGVARRLGMAFLMGICVVGLWRENVAWARVGAMSARMSAQLPQHLGNVPEGDLVVIWPGASRLVASGWGEMLPYAVKPPFTRSDLYARVQAIEEPGMSCCPGPQWAERTRAILEAKSSAGPIGNVEIDVLEWNEQSQTFQERRAAVTRGELRHGIASAMGAPIETADIGGQTQTQNLLRGLVALGSVAGTPGVSNPDSASRLHAIGP